MGNVYDYYIGLDPGTNCGWAVLDKKGNRVESGTWVRRPRKGQEPMSLGQLLAQQLDQVDSLCSSYANKPCLFIFENVQFSSGGSRSSHIMGVMKAATELTVSFYDEVSWLPVGVPTWKKKVLGNAKASKKEYLEYANIRFRLELRMKHEDEASALCLAQYGYQSG